MSLLPSFIETLRKFTYFNVASYLGPGEDHIQKTEQNKRALNFFQHYGLLPSISTMTLCDHCQTKLTVEKDKRKNILGFRWKCSNYSCEKFNRKISPLTNTLFSNSNVQIVCLSNTDKRLGLSSILILLVLWYFKLGVAEAKLFGEIGSPSTSSEWYGRFRAICRLVEDHDSEKIGGNNDVVEVDESHLYKRKYSMGRILYSESNLWIFGGISRLTGKKFAVRVHCRDKKTLQCEMVDNIDEGSYIISDGWRSYRSCPINCGFKGHSWVNHSKGQFVDPEPVIVENLHKNLGTRVLVDPPSTSTADPSFREISVHTNNVERMWRGLKERCKNIRGNDDLIDNCIGEWLYRANILDSSGLDHGTKFIKVLKDIQRVFPGLGVKGISNVDCECLECTINRQPQLN